MQEAGRGRRSMSGQEMGSQEMGSQEMSGQMPYWMERQSGEERLKGNIHDFLICVAVLTGITALGWMFYLLGFSDATIITLYLLGIMIISVGTVYRAWCLAASVAAVVVFNFFFTMPK